MPTTQKTASPTQGAKVRKIIDQHQQVIVATPIRLYSTVAGESHGTLMEYAGSD